MIEGYNAPSRIDLRSSWNLFFGGGALYQIAKERGLDFTLSDVTSTSTLVFGKKLEPDYKFKLGFSALFGFFTDFDNWDFQAAFFRYHPHITTSVNALPTGALVMRWFSSSPRASSAVSRWNLLWNQVDTEMGRSFFVGKELSMRPFLGPRLLWGKQRYKISASISDLDGQEKISRNTSQYWCLGPRLGLCSNWHLTKSFTIQGKLASSFIYEKNRVHAVIDDATTSSFQKSFDVKTLYREIKPQLDARIGIHCGTYFSHYKWHFKLLLDYVFQIFWEENKMRALVDELVAQTGASPGALSIHGANVSLEFSF